MYLNLNIHIIISKQKNINIYTRISYIKVLRPWQTYKLYTYICIYVSGLVKGRFCTCLLCGLTAKWGQGRWPHKGLNVQPALWRSASNSLWAKHVCTTSHWQVANKQSPSRLLSRLLTGDSRQLLTLLSLTQKIEHLMSEPCIHLTICHHRQRRSTRCQSIYSIAVRICKCMFHEKGVRP